MSLDYYEMWKDSEETIIRLRESYEALSTTLSGVLRQSADKDNDIEIITEQLNEAKMDRTSRHETTRITTALLQRLLEDKVFPENGRGFVNVLLKLKESENKIKHLTEAFKPILRIQSEDWMPQTRRLEEKKHSEDCMCDDCLAASGVCIINGYLDDCFKALKEI